MPLSVQLSHDVRWGRLYMWYLVLTSASYDYTATTGAYSHEAQTRGKWCHGQKSYSREVACRLSPGVTFEKFLCISACGKVALPVLDYGEVSLPHALMHKRTFPTSGFVCNQLYFRCYLEAIQAYDNTKERKEIGKKNRKEERAQLGGLSLL